jgi:hypothetical protein
MAYIKRFQPKGLASRKTSHKESNAAYSTFEHDGRKFIQFVSYGHGRAPLKITQTIQLDRDGAFDLYTILKQAFGFE